MTNWVVLVFTALLTLPACGPGLQRSDDFTPKKVREIKFSDQCQLQRYFNGQPPPLRPVAESSIGKNPRDGQAGKLTFQLGNARQSRMFVTLLRRHYKQLPAWIERVKGQRVTVGFFRRGHNHHMPIGAEIVLEHQHDDDKTTLPYHPCLGAFFFGQDYYGMRRRLLAQGPLL